MMHRDDTRTFRKQSKRLAGVLALAVALLGAQATSWAAPGADRASPAPAAAATEPRAASTSQTMAQSYAARETSSKPLEAFKGGDPVIIVGSGTLVIVLLVVLILVII